MLKLSRNLFFHEPDPKYMNYYEQGLFNQILALAARHRQRHESRSHVLRPGAPGRAPELWQRRHVLRRHGDGESHEVPGLDLLPVDGRRDALCQSLHPVDARVAREGIHHRAGDALSVRGREHAHRARERPAGRHASRAELGASRLHRVGERRAQQLAATPGHTSRSTASGSTGDRIEIAMPLTLPRGARRSTIRRCSRSSTARRSWRCRRRRWADTLETGLINVSLYKHFKLTGDFASAMTPVADKPLHFTYNGQTLAPFFVSDPQAGRNAAVPYVRPAA